MRQARIRDTDRGVNRRVQAVLLAGSLVIGAATSEAQSPVKQVLLLQSLDRGNLIIDRFTGEFRVRLDENAGKSVNVVQIVLGPTGSVGAREQATVDYVRAMYADRPPPDLIVTSGGPAAVFARKYRQQLFPRTPLLLASVDQRYLGSAPVGENETAVAVANDYPGVVDEILRLLPETRQVFMITGSGAIGRFWRGELQEAFSRFRDRVTFIWSNELSLLDILGRVASLPPHSVIFYLVFGTDALGGAYADEQVLADLHARANSPMFAAHSPLLGSGIVGGSLMSVDDVGRNAADVATRILNGEPTAGLRVPPQVRSELIYDWRELRRWDIPESRLPPGSVVQYRPPSLWAEYKPTVLSALGALTLQSLLIGLLLYERRARQRAEIESRKNLDLAADANRRETISALTGSIGHELGQPLSAIVHNAQTLQMLATANRVAPDMTAEIATDIQAEAALAGQIIERHRTMLRSHQLEKTPIDLHKVIEESVALLAHDMRAREVEVTLELSPLPCVIDGDHVVLEQVLVNLIKNAVDALSEMPPGRRHITIRTAVSATQVEISVSDTGPGLSAEILGTLFTPFVTTKSRGLGIGLTIAQRIVHAHHGAIVFRETVEGGATFTVTLPRSATTAASLNGQTPQIHAEDGALTDGD